MYLGQKGHVLGLYRYFPSFKVGDRFFKSISPITIRPPRQQDSNVSIQIRLVYSPSVQEKDFRRSGQIHVKSGSVVVFFALPSQRWFGDVRSNHGSEHRHHYKVARDCSQTFLSLNNMNSLFADMVCTPRRDPFRKEER
jgi:hypothetical protein